MSTSAVRIPDPLLERVKIAAKSSNRTTIGQIEHWLRIGESVEEKLTVGEINDLKHGNNAEMDQVIAQLRAADGRSDFRSRSTQS